MDQNSIELRPTGAPASPRLRRHLSGIGVLLLALSSLSPVLSAYGIGSDVLLHAGSGAAILFLLGIGVALVFGLVYAELGSAYPHAGGDYVGVGSILGGWAGVSSMAIWAATSGPNIAFAAKVFAEYAGPLAPAVPAPVLVYGSLAAATAVALLAVRASAWITGLFLADGVEADRPHLAGGHDQGKGEPGCEQRAQEVRGVGVAVGGESGLAGPLRPIATAHGVGPDCPGRSRLAAAANNRFDFLCRDGAPESQARGTRSRPRPAQRPAPDAPAPGAAGPPQCPPRTQAFAGPA